LLKLRERFVANALTLRQTEALRNLSHGTLGISFTLVNSRLAQIRYEARVNTFPVSQHFITRAKQSQNKAIVIFTRLTTIARYIP
jgi:hypothetical protein